MRAADTAIRAKAPLRVSFAGGGTDVAPFPATEGGVVLSSTINRYAYGSLRPREDRRITVESIDFGISLDLTVDDELAFDGKLDLVKAAIRRLGQVESGGYDLVLRSSAPPGSGLGSSSTVMVALVALLQEYYGVPLTEYEIADTAFRIEREDLGIEGGLQDHYAATFGGFNFIEFGDRVIVNPLRIRDSIVNELELSLMLCFTGVTRESTNIISDQTSRVVSRQGETLDGLRRQKELAVEMKAALLRGELTEFGGLLDEAWAEKKRMSPLISTPRIDEAYELARRNGAVGGKVTGAGGGGYILFFCDFDRKHRVAEALESMGAVVSEFSFERDGVTTWRA
jgi:D-glycero-alpha-D-manno-heptose-7-phosphate kinase